MLGQFFDRLRDKRREYPISLLPEAGTRGVALLSYSTQVYKRIAGGMAAPAGHTAGWENYQISQNLLKQGFAVDVIEYTDEMFEPKRQYDLLIDVRSGLERLSTLCPAAIKIYHATSAHWLHNNGNNYRRMLDLYSRRAVSVKPRRIMPSSTSAEVADHLILRAGSGYGADSYAHCNAASVQYHASVNETFSYPAARNPEEARRHFLWLGGAGLVHKGLDLVLEAFVDTDLQLHICADLGSETDFTDAYAAELARENIHVHGFVDVTKPEFVAILAQCAAIVNMSASECGPSAIPVAMHGGLVPIVNYESDMISKAHPIVVADSSVDSIRSAVVEFAGKSANEIDGLCRQAWLDANEWFTRQRFDKEYANALAIILQSHQIPVK